jgi:hypothetical protein
MNKNEPSNIWLPEPEAPDESYADRGEHTLDWLARSTNQTARECRRFLNKNLLMLPKNVQDSIRGAADHRWKSAFFELIVARILQELGATIELEQTNSEGRRPDFTARFPDGTIIVEAMSPVFNVGAGETIKNRNPLYRIIEANLPQGWSVGVRKLPSIGPNDSKKEFERTIKELLSIPPPGDGMGNQDLSVETSTGVIHLHLRPGEIDSGRLIWEAPITTFDNSEQRIRHAVKKKREQVRSSHQLVLLAIEASGISSGFEDFDKALFGHTYESYDVKLQLERRGFKRDGAFTRGIRNNRPPTYAGVLAFLYVGFLGGPAPVLYYHPRFTGHLPESILRLEQRRYDIDSNEVQVVSAEINDLMQRLEFVQP